MDTQQFIVRNARPAEFGAVGKLMVMVYSQLDGFPKENEQPAYYQMLANIGELTKKPATELLVAEAAVGKIAGAVVYFSDMQYYGSGGAATQVKNASGFRLLAVAPAFRSQGVGRLLTTACIDKARRLGQEAVVLHTTRFMQVAWKMYERLGFERWEHLDFMQGQLGVFGFRLKL